MPATFKQPRPGCICSNCRRAKATRFQYKRCGCGGRFEPIDGTRDWRECPMCEGVGDFEEELCVPCLGAGWILASPKQES